jgi:hypothetical protein
MNTEFPSIINKELKEKTGNLDLNFCGIENIPKDVSKLTHLVSLNLYINIISDQHKREEADKIKLDF